MEQHHKIYRSRLIYLDHTNSLEIEILQKIFHEYSPCWILPLYIAEKEQSRKKYRQISSLQPPSISRSIIHGGVVNSLRLPLRPLPTCSSFVEVITYFDPGAGEVGIRSFRMTFRNTRFDTRSIGGRSRDGGGWKRGASPVDRMLERGIEIRDRYPTIIIFFARKMYRL